MGNKWKLFIDTALSHVGEDKQWVEQIMGQHYNAWCAAFVSACARFSGISARISYNDTTKQYTIRQPGIIVESGTCWYMAKAGTENNCGIWINGPYLGSYPTPLPGDLILFHWQGKNYRKWAGKFESYHIGIIYNVIGDTIYAVEGNTRRGKGPKYATVRTLQYSTNYKCIQGYYRPNWYSVGAYIEGVNYDGSGYGGYVNSDLPFIPVKSRNDPILREVGYLNNEYKPSILVEGLKLSVIDYLSPLGSMFGNEMQGQGYEAILDKLSNIIQIIIQHFITCGVNAAVGVGIVANMLYESGLNASKESIDGLKCGICQWTGLRKSAMLQYVGKDWKFNLSKQLEFVWNELNIKFLDLLINLSRLENSEIGAITSVELFATEYQNVHEEIEIKKRQDSAKEIWKYIVIQYKGDNSGSIIVSPPTPTSKPTPTPAPKPTPSKPWQTIGEN